MLEDGHSLHFQLHIINRVVIGQHRGSERRKRDAYQIDSGNHGGGFTARRYANEAATAMKTCGYVNISIGREREALGASQAAVPDARFTMGVDCPDRIV